MSASAAATSTAAAITTVWIVNGEQVKLEEEAKPLPKLLHTWSSQSLAKELRAPVPSPRAQSVKLAPTASMFSSTNPMFAEQDVRGEDAGEDGEEEDEEEGRPSAGSFITPLSDVLREMETLKRQNQVFRPKKQSDDSSTSTITSRSSMSISSNGGSGGGGSLIRKFSNLNLFRTKGGNV